MKRNPKYEKPEMASSLDMYAVVPLAAAVLVKVVTAIITMAVFVVAAAASVKVSKLIGGVR